MRSLIRIGSLITFLIPLSGCVVGYNSLIFATKSNMGVDIDTQPPTAEISIARHEGVIEPTFEDGKTPPVSASFGSRVGGFQRLFTGVSSTFATGPAAVAMTDLYNADTPVVEKSQKISAYKEGVELSETPKRKSFVPGLGLAKVPYLERGMVKPLFFGTHSTLGLKVEWNGTTGQYPSAVKFGFNRKELAFAPVTMMKAKPNDPSSKEMRANAPSLLASVDTDMQLSTFNDGNNFTYIQYFATGDAATNLATQKDVRAAMLRKSSPDLAPVTPPKKVIFDAAVAPNQMKLRSWFAQPQTGTEIARRKGLLESSIEPGESYTTEDLLTDPLPIFEERCKKFIQAHPGETYPN